MPTPSLLGFLQDRDSWQTMGKGLLDAANRGLLAQTIGAPVDLATQAVNLGVAGAGYAGHKMGLLSQPPELIDPTKVPGSSDWIGNKMQRAGMVSADRNPIAEAGMGLLSPVAAKGAQKVGGLLAAADLAMAENAANAPRMTMGGQRGVIRFPSDMTKPQRSAEVKRLAEDAAAQLSAQGFEVDLQHSGSVMGPSSYLRVFDPHTGRAVRDPLRISDHSKGPFNSTLVHDASGPEDIQAFIDAALKMRGQGESQSMQQMRQAYAANSEKVRQSWLAVYERASQKQANGEPLSNKERQSIAWVAKNGLE